MTTNPMQDLDTFFDPDWYPVINGKTYRVPEPTAADGLRLVRAMTDPKRSLDDAAELAMIAKILGAVWVPKLVEVVQYDDVTFMPILDDQGQPVTRTEDDGEYEGGVWSELEADGVGHSRVMHLGLSALVYYGLGSRLGEAHWLGAVGDQGNPPPPATGDRSSKPAKRAAAKKAAKKAPTKKAATARTRAPQAATAKVTPAAATTTPQPDSATGTTPPHR